MENRIIMEGGRLKKLTSTMIASIQYWCWRIVISQNLLSHNIIRKTRHSISRGLTLNEFRSSGFWITHSNSVTGFLICYFVTCGNVRRKLREQLMFWQTSIISPIEILWYWLIWSFYHHKLRERFEKVWANVYVLM